PRLHASAPTVKSMRSLPPASGAERSQKRRAARRGVGKRRRRGSEDLLLFHQFIGDALQKATRRARDRLAADRALATSEEVQPILRARDRYVEKPAFFLDVVGQLAAHIGRAPVE